MPQIPQGMPTTPMAVSIPEERTEDQKGAIMDQDQAREVER